MKIDPNFNPNGMQDQVVRLTGHMPCRNAILFMTNHLLIANNYSYQSPEALFNDGLRTEIAPDEQGLSIDCRDEKYAQALATELEAQGFKQVSHDGKTFKISSENSDDANEVHREIARFITYTLNAWKTLSVSNYSFLRDLYCDTSGSETGLNVAEDIKSGLRVRFDEVHWAHKKTSVANRRQADGLSKGLSNDNVGKRLQNIQKLMGAMQLASMNLNLEQQPDLRTNTSENLKGKAKEAAEKKEEDLEIPVAESSSGSSSKATRAAERFEIGGVQCSYGGDYFGDIKKTAGSKPGAVAILGADNAFRPGGAAIIGSTGSIEENFCRMSNYLLKLSQSLDAQDPIRHIIDHLLMKEGVVISADDIGAYIRHTHYMSTASTPERAGYNTYHKHKEEHTYAPLVEDVAVSVPGGTTSVDVVGMAGIDTRDSLMTNALNNHEEQAAKEAFKSEVKTFGFYSTKVFNEKKIKSAYIKRYEAAIPHLLQNAHNEPRETVILIAVGAGAFDASSQHEKKYAKCSAEAFAEVWFKPMEQLGGHTPADYVEAHNIQVKLPIYNDKVVYQHFKEALTTQHKKAELQEIQAQAPGLSNAP